MAIFTDVFSKVDLATQDIVAGNISKLMSTLEPLLLSSFTFYLLFVLVSYWNGSFEDIIIDLYKRTISWFVIIGFSLNISNYNTVVMPIVIGLGDGLSIALNDQANSTVLDNMMNSMIGIIVSNQDMAATLPMPLSLGAYIESIIYNAIIIISFSSFFVLSSAYILLAKIFLNILGLIGPLFISLALFPATRQYFTNWLNQVLNYSLLLLLMNITSTMMIKIFSEILNISTIDYPITISFLVGVVVLSLVFFVILLKIPDLASGLVGGVSADGFGQAGRSIKSLTTGKKFKSKNNREEKVNKNQIKDGK